MEPYLFAGIPVSDYQRSLEWYERFLGRPPSFLPNDVEAVWDLAQFRSLYILLEPEDAGHGHVTLFLSEADHEAFVAEVRDRGIEPVLEETYENGVRKATYADPDGNDVGVGGGPVE